MPVPIEPDREALQDGEEEADDLSQVNKWLTVFEHTRDVCQKLDEILRAAELPEPDIKILRLAARWHDRGKAHNVFQSKLKPEMLAGDLLSKGLWGSLRPRLQRKPG